MRVTPYTTRHKKRVIKWEYVISTVYIAITLFKYFITSNKDIATLIYDLSIDFLLGLLIYNLIKEIRKELAR